MFSGKSLQFGNNNATLNAGGRAALGSLAKALANLRLSQLRSQAVATSLAGLGAPAARMVTRGFGPTRPIASNDTRDGQLLNRRVEGRVYPGERPAVWPEVMDSPEKARRAWASRSMRPEKAATAALPVPAPRIVVAPAPVPSAMNFALPAAGLPPLPSGLAERVEALRRGDLAKAIELGRQRIAAIPPNHWTLRLEVADLPATLQTAVASFPASDPDLFIAPLKLRGGKTSYQLFLGDYASKAEAERAVRSVPVAFLEGGQRPKPYLGTGIPSRRGQ